MAEIHELEFERLIRGKDTTPPPYRWKRWEVGLFIVCSAIASSFLFSPLILWLTPPGWPQRIAAWAIGVCFGPCIGGP